MEVIRLKKLLSLALAAALALSLTACGGGGEKSGGASSPKSGGSSSVSSGSSDANSGGSTSDGSGASVSDGSGTSSGVDNPDSSAPAGNKAQVISVGDTISLDFVEMTIEEAGIEDDIQRSITTGNVTRITGPKPEDGKQFLYIKGTIKNLDTDGLPVFDFFTGKFVVDGYNFEVSANDCDIITAEGQMLSTIDPLTTGSYIIYASIPDELVNSHTDTSFSFGFYDLFDNSKLAESKAFSEDPIADCPYQYTMDLGV